MEISPSGRRAPGRPPSFEREAALGQAMHLFWRHGYEATSVAMLTRGMGITAPSLYAAFGDKRRLFLAAVDRYLQGGRAVPALIDGAATARQAARDLLTAAAIGDTGETTPAGCLLASAIVTCSEEAADVREALAAMRRAIEARLRERIEADIAAGCLPPGTDAEALAGHAMAVVQGMSTLAKDGAGRAKLLRIVEAAMAGWPPGGA